MKIDLTASEDAVKIRELAAPPESIELIPPEGSRVLFAGEARARLEVRRVGEEFFVGGDLAVPVKFTCVRCLKEYQVDLTAALELIVHRVRTPESGERDVEAYVEVPLGVAEYNVGPHVREALLLALPETPHCKEDCKGLCGRCGADLNVESCSCSGAPTDPRWDGLKQLLTVEN